MKRLILVLVLFLGFTITSFAQAPIVRQVSINSQTPGTAIDVRALNLRYHRLSWTIANNFVNTCATALQKSDDAITWSDLIAAATCTSSGTTAITAATTNWIRINPTTFSGNGIISATYTGFVTNPDTAGISLSAAAITCLAALLQPTLVDAVASPCYQTLTGNLRTSVFDPTSDRAAAVNAANALKTYLIDMTANTAQTAYGNGDPVPQFEPTAGGAISVATKAGSTERVNVTLNAWTPFNATAADGATACTATAQQVKGSAGVFGGYYANNPNTADEWLHIYNALSANVTVGTTAPLVSIRLSGAAANSIGANLEIANGLTFGTGISIACTSSAGGTGAPSNALEVNIFYR